MSKILDHIRTGQEARTNALIKIRQLLDYNSLSPPDGYPFYGYNLSNTTIARFRPWDMWDRPTNSALNDEALFNIRQFNAIAPKGVGYELGVYNGGVSRMLMDEGRRMVCFDTFEGVAGSSSYDMIEDGEYRCFDEGDVRRLLQGAQIVKGDVMETLITRKQESVAFVHLDMDVYAPTRYALQQIWGQMIHGGVIVCDDYGVWCTDGVKQAVDEFLDFFPHAKSIYLQTGQMVIIK